MMTTQHFYRNVHFWLILNEKSSQSAHVCPIHCAPFRVFFVQPELKIERSLNFTISSSNKQ